MTQGLVREHMLLRQRVQVELKESRVEEGSDTETTQ